LLGLLRINSGIDTVGFKFDTKNNPEKVFFDFLNKNLHEDRALKKFILLFSTLKEELNCVAEGLSKEQATKINNLLEVNLDKFIKDVNENLENKTFRKDYEFIKSIKRNPQAACLGPYMADLWFKVVDHYEHINKSIIFRFFYFIKKIFLYIQNYISNGFKRIYTFFNYPLALFCHKILLLSGLIIRGDYPPRYNPEDLKQEKSIEVVNTSTNPFDALVTASIKSA
jgi:hypothetical protein